MHQYLDLLYHIREHGEQRADRTGTGTVAVFGTQERYDLRKGFPAVTTKKLAWKAVVSELLWFLEGSNDERRLCEILHGTRDESKTTIWTDNANADYWEPKARFKGDVGNIYGVQWRSWGPRLGPKVDQVAQLIDGLKKDPYGRRHLLTAWNPGELNTMALPPCHIMSQFYVSNNGELSCHMYQRSCDFFLGVPFNIASYSLFTHMLAQVCGYTVGEFVHSTGDSHIYLDHIEQVNIQLTRSPYVSPTLKINPDVKNIDDFTMGDFELVNYQHHPSIAAPMSK